MKRSINPFWLSFFIETESKNLSCKVLSSQRMMRYLFVTLSALLFGSLTSLAQLAQTVAKKPVTDTMIQNFQPASTRLSNTTLLRRRVAPSQEQISAYLWWRSINPYDLSIYRSPFQLVPHQQFDTTVEKFLGKQSLTFKGWLFKEGWPRWRSDSLMHLRVLKDLKQLELQEILVNDTVFRILGTMSQLKAIYYHSETITFNPNMAVTDAGLAALLQNTSLEYIGFQNLANITDAGFAHFGKLKNLKELHTQAWTGITDKALLSLEGCTSLEKLYLVSSNITDLGLSNLLQIKDKLPRLRHLYLNFSKVTAAGITYLQSNWGTPINVHFVP
jgi:hypothetical protein